MKTKQADLSDTPRVQRTIGRWNLSVAKRRVTPVNDNKPKDAEITPFQAGSDFIVSAMALDDTPGTDIESKFHFEMFEYTLVK